MPGDINWFQTLGSATLTAFLVQALTGTILAMYYKPDPKDAYASIQNITNDLFAGWLVRGMHRWGASVFIILMFMHMGRVFLFGAYKYPRELNWILGVLLLTMGLAEGFTGYLLPWDQTAYWATIVGVNINGTGPIIGPFLAQFLQGGTAIGGDTLSRFYAIHMLLIPGLIFALIGLHLYLVVRLGVTSPPWSKEAAGTGPLGSERHQRTASGPGLTRPRRRGQLMASDRIVERRRIFQQYKEDVKERGKPFFPYAMWHDTIMSFVVVCVIIGLAIVWKYSTPGNHHTGEAGWLGKLYDAPADPGTINFVPRPDWYFYFLFYLLRIFKWPHSVILGTIGIPTIALVLLLAIPFIDLRTERRLSRRPVAIIASILVVISMGVLTYKGATAKESLGSELIGKVPQWAAKQGFTANTQAVAGREAVRRRGLSQLPHVPRRRRWLRRGARADGGGREEQGHRVPDRAPQMPGVRERRLADAVVRRARRRAAETARDVPRGLQGPEVAPA